MTTEPLFEHEKRCNVCGESKPLSEFYRAAGMKDGRRNDCKACNLAAKAARYRANPKAAIERTERWREANKERFLEYQRQRRQRPEVKRRQRDGHLRRKFGITVEEYEARLEQQGGGCAICGSPPPDGISLHVDHDHETERIRGLTCFSCNAAMGHLRDDLELIEAILFYVATHRRVARLIARD